MINDTGFKGQTELKTKAFKIDAKGSTWGLSQPRLSEVWGWQRGPPVPSYRSVCCIAGGGELDELA